MPPQDSPNESKIRVLITEDEESFLGVLTRVLHSTDRFTVVSCETGEASIEALKGSHFDVIVLDLKLPGMSGLGVLQWMHEQKLDTPVIVLTGTGSEFIAAETMKYGAYDYVAKTNFDKDSFPNIVAGAFDHYRLRKEKIKAEDGEQQSDWVSVEILYSSISSLAHVARKALTNVKLLNEECHATLQPLLTPEGRTQLRNNYDTIKREHEVITAVMTSIMELSTAMVHNRAGIQKGHTSKNSSDLKVEKQQSQDANTSDDGIPFNA